MPFRLPILCHKIWFNCILLQNIEDIIQLSLPHEGKEGDEKTRIYTVPQLNDLQSKLMLVAGKAEKGKDEVDRFVEVKFSESSKCAIVYLGQKHFPMSFACT